MARQQLPPQITKIVLDSTGEVRYQLIADIGINPETGKRAQFKKRYRTEDEAKKKLAEITHQVNQGTYVPNSDLTIETACADWLAGKRIRKTTMAAYRHSLQPLRDRHGTLPVQKLSKRQLDDLVSSLEDGTFVYAHGRSCKPWGAQTLNPMLRHISAVLKSLVDEGKMPRDVASIVDRLATTKEEMQTYSVAELKRVLAEADKDRDGHAWHLALSGLRRGEICGLRWSDVNLEAGELTIVHNRVQVDGVPVDGDPKTEKSGRTLPLSATLKRVLRRARKVQAAEKLALGEAYGDGGYVVCDEAGQPYYPDKVTKMWVAVCKKAKVRRIRLHDARHTCGTLMHLQGVPIAVISAWLGHADSAFTMRTYMHSQDDALASAAATLDALVTTRDNSGSASHRRKRARNRKTTG